MAEYLTKEKYEELSKELRDLKSVKRKEVAENLEYAKSLGDLSENAEYHEAREAQAKLEDRIMKLEGLLKSASIVENKKGEIITIGSTALVQKEGGKETYSYKLVGSEEADVLAGKISIHSPLGVALQNKKKGEMVSFNAPGGLIKYKIISVE